MVGVNNPDGAAARGRVQAALERVLACVDWQAERIAALEFELDVSYLVLRLPTWG